MKQSLHIFLKDVRHLWPELVTYAVLLITFAWAIPQNWLGTEPNAMVQILAVLLRALIPILWLVIIARLIQDESLVGDQQFWITRPYTRGSLLGAKLFFLAGCIILPFALMQCYLLLHAGLHPFASLPALSLNLLILALLCWLPFAAVASVTSTLPRMAMSVVGTSIVSIIIMVFLGRATGLHMEPPYFFEAVATLFTLLSAGALLYQYRTRRTKYARIVLLATPVLLLLLFLLYPTGWIVSHRYSAAKDGAAHLVFDPDPLLREPQEGKETSFGGRVMVNLPVHVEGLDRKARLDNAGVSVTLDAPGYHYQSSWLPGGIGDSAAMLILPADVVHKLQSVPAHVHMVLVADELLPGAPEHAIAASRFDIPGHGICFLSEDVSGPTFCRYAYHAPAPTEITGPVTLPPCGPGSPSRNGVAQIRSNTMPTFDPVFEEPLRLGLGVLCSGSQLNFAAYNPAGHLRSELDIPSVLLGAYIRHNGSGGRGMPNTAPPTPPAGAVVAAPPSAPSGPSHPPAPPKSIAP